MRVLDRSKRLEGLGKGVKEGRIWTYLRDDRPWGGTAPPGVAYFFSLDRKSAHPHRHLAEFSGILQADAYTGFKALYEPDATGAVRIREAACWAHLRRDFHDVWTGTKSEIAREALDRIGRSTTLNARSPAAPPKSGGALGRPARALWRRTSRRGRRPSSAGSPARAHWPKPSATRSAAGPPSRSSWRTAAWPSTTTRPSVRSSPW